MKRQGKKKSSEPSGKPSSKPPKAVYGITDAIRMTAVLSALAAKLESVDAKTKINLMRLVIAIVSVPDKELSRLLSSEAAKRLFASVEGGTK